MKSLQSEILVNRMKTFGLFFLFGLLTLGIMAGLMYLLTGGINPVTLAIGAGAALVFMVGYYFFASKIALALNKAVPISSADAPELYDMIKDLTTEIGMPMPKVYIMNEEMQLNAFATGRNEHDGHIAFTRGILETLDYEQLRGVAAHELAHVKNEDIKIMTMAAAIATVIGLFVSMASNVLWFSDRRNLNPIVMIIALVALSIFAPLAAGLIQSSISRNREALADASAVKYTRDPRGLREALTRISGSGSQVSTAKEATAHMFFNNPLPLRTSSGKPSMMQKLFSTHPPIEDRINRLANFEDDIRLP